jgi:hypothetical protein
MGIDRSRRSAFEEVADLYDEVRPGYPDELIADALSLSQIPADGRILEIGCDPGNATGCLLGAVTTCWQSNWENA